LFDDGLPNKAQCGFDGRRRFGTCCVKKAGLRRIWENMSQPAHEPFPPSRLQTFANLVLTGPDRVKFAELEEVQRIARRKQRNLILDQLGKGQNGPQN